VRASREVGEAGTRQEGRESRGRSGPALSEFNDPTAETVASSPKGKSAIACEDRTIERLAALSASGAEGDPVERHVLVASTRRTGNKAIWSDFHCAMRAIAIDCEGLSRVWKVANG
jgi:hypothetical protein